MLTSTTSHLFFFALLVVVAFPSALAASVRGSHDGEAHKLLDPVPLDDGEARKLLDPVPLDRCANLKKVFKKATKGAKKCKSQEDCAQGTYCHRNGKCVGSNVCKKHSDCGIDLSLVPKPMQEGCRNLISSCSCSATCNYDCMDCFMMFPAPGFC